MIGESLLCKSKPVRPASRVSFHCTQCGNCCRHVKYSVPLETLDLFRLARFLKSQGNEFQDMEAVLLQDTSDLDTAFLPQFKENIRLLLQNPDQMVKESRGMI